MENCWLWAGTIENDYPRLWVVNRHVRAHRAVYEALVGPIPKGLSLDHLCKVKRCVNPAHLEPVTHAENVKRGNSGKANREKTHCPKGHEYTAENTHINKGKRITRGCRTCRNTARKEKRHEDSLRRV